VSDPRRDELVAKISALVLREFQGDYRSAFDFYAVNGRLKYDQVYTLLTDAGVGWRLTRGAYASGLLAAVDTDGDGISYEEFEVVAVTKARGASPAMRERNRNLAILRSLMTSLHPTLPDESFALGVLGRAMTQIEAGDNS
jgi:hypothetical protein